MCNCSCIVDPNINIISIVIAVAVAVVVIAGIITTVCVILMVHKKVTEQPHQPQRLVVAQ